MGRLSKFLVQVAAWRWTPCVGLGLSSVLFVLVALIAVPSKLTLGGAVPASKTTLDLPDQSDALTAPMRRSPERSLPAPPPRHPFTPVTPAPAAPPPPPPVPEPPPPMPEEKHEEPPPPPAPPPPATEEDDDDQNEPPPMPQQPPRLGATPLRFLPQINRAVGNTPAPAPPAGNEPPAEGEPPAE